MRFARLALLASAVGLLLASATGACGADAVGVEACRQIESARCEATAACGASASEVAYCLDVYRDQCLHGLRSGATEPGTDATTRCVEAIGAVAACARAGATSMEACPAEPLVASATPVSFTPCTVLTRSPEVLADCAFVAPPEDAGTPPDPTSDAGADGDASGDATID